MDTVRESGDASQSLPDSTARIIRAISERQILRARKERTLEFNCCKTIADRRIHHELAGNGHTDRPAFHPHSPRYNSIETANLFSPFLINQRGEIRIVPRVLKEEPPEMDLEFAGRKGIPRKHSFVQVHDFWNIVWRKGTDSLCTCIGSVPGVSFG